MITNVQKAFNKAKEENRKATITYIYKYVNFKDSVAIKELLEIDLIKNNFKKSTLQNYLVGIRRYLNTGSKAGVLAPYAYDIVDELKAKHYAMLTPPADAKHRVLVRKKNNSGKTIFVSKVDTISDTSEDIESPVVTSPVSTVSSKTYPQLLTLKNKLELESATMANKIKQLQEKQQEHSTKLQALEVVLGMLK